MSSCEPNLSQPQLLSPKFFEQPPKLLPPSIFRQTVAARHQAHTNSKSEVVADADGDEVSRGRSPENKKESEPAKKQTTVPNEHITKTKESSGHLVTKKIKLSSSDKADSIDEGTFNSKYDNQLLLVAENVSYTLAVKQRWKDSGNLAMAPVRDEKDLKKIMEYTCTTASTRARGDPTTAKGQPEALAKNPPTAEIESKCTSNTSSKAKAKETSHSTATRVVRPPVETAVSRKGVDASKDFRLPAVHSASFKGTSRNPEYFRDRYPSTHKSLASVPGSRPVPSVALGTNKHSRNNFDKVKSFASKLHTTDNLKQSQEKNSRAISLDTCDQRKSSSHPTPLVDNKTKTSYPSISAGGGTCSPPTVRSSETTMAVAMDTESDLALACVLQGDEYSCGNGSSGEYVMKKKEVQAKPKSLDIDCSSDAEIARRLQQDLDAEVAYSMQKEDQDYHGPRPGLGRRLGGDEVQRRNVREEVEGYYDNNNQYHYTIREHVSEYPVASVGGGARATSSSLPRRPLSHQHFHSGATAFPREEVDMSYETLVELEDVSRGLDKATISRLSNTYKHHSSSSTDKSCSICLNEFENGQTLRSLPCIHAFHKNCIDKWLTNKRHCPVCMKDIDTM